MGIMGRTPDYMNMKFSAFASAPEVWAGADGRNERGARNVVSFQRRIARDDVSLTHTIIQPTIDKRTDAQDRRQQGHHPQGRRDRRRHRRARGAGAGDARALRRREAVYPGQPIPAERQGLRRGLRHPARHAGPQVPVPRFGGGAGRRSVRQAAVVALRRAGRVLHLRRRAGAVGPRVHRRRRRDLQLDARDRLRHPHDHPVDHPRPDQAGVRLRPRDTHGRADRRPFARDDRDAGRARLLRAPDRQRPGAVARAGVGARRRGVVSQRRRARADALDAAGLDAAGGRDHHADRQPQPADDARAGPSSTTRRCGR